MKMNLRGQNIIEYILLFAIVVIVVLVATRPGGFLTRSVNESLDAAIKGLEDMPEEAFPEK